MNLANYLNNCRQQIDAALDQAMPAADERPTVLHRAMRYAMFPGGKRLRPALCMAATEALGAAAARAMTPGMAIELLHAYTLIHDDLPCMDDDRMRRGKPTVHVAFGEAVAVLAGDALQTLAFELLADYDADQPDIAARLVAELARAAGSRGVIGGQIEDIAAADGTPDRATIEFIHGRKTADLFQAALRMGALAGRGNAAQVTALALYGFKIGVAFQIADDLLDARDATQSVPQSPEASCLQVMSSAEARTLTRHLIADAGQALAAFESRRVEPLLAIAQWIEDRACGQSASCAPASEPSESLGANENANTGGLRS